MTTVVARGATSSSVGREAPYRYRAAQADGTVVRGTIEASSPEAAGALLTARGLWPIALSVQPRAQRPMRRALPAQDLATGLRVLASLLETGLPLGRTLAAYDHLAPPTWRGALPAVTAAVRDGHGLATALARAPLGVPPVVLGMLRAGEAGGGLAAAVRRAADHAERAAATQATFRAALAYPLVLFVVGSASLALLVGVVIPRFAAILADLGQTLPTSTRLVLTTGDMVRNWALPAGIVGAVGAGVWRAWVATEAGRRAWHRLLLAIPVVGAVRAASATGRVCAAWASLLESGVPAATALTSAADAGGDAALGARLEKARTAVVSGGRIATALDHARALTPGAVRLVRAGEESGQLATMLAHAGALETAFAERRLKAVLRLLEPTLVLGFGLVVAVVASALLQAVYSVRPG